MKTISCGILFTAVVVAVSVAAETGARAQTPPTPAMQALQKGQEAMDLFAKARFDEALPKFEEAERLYHSPVFELYIGRSLRASKRWVEASIVLRRVSRETLESSSPRPWKTAQADATRELDDLIDQIPSVVIVVQGSTVSTQATIDGHAVPLEEPVEVDPGTHRVTATDGERTQEEAVTLVARTKGLRVVLTLPALTPATPVAKTLQPAPPTGMYRPGLVTAGAGALAIALGSVVGVVALVEGGSALPESCRGQTCRTSERASIESDLELPRRLGNVADILFITGGIAVVVGAYLVLTHDRKAGPQALSPFWRF